MKLDKQQWNERLKHSLEIKRQAQEEARLLLTRLQHELDTTGQYSIAK